MLKAQAVRLETGLLFVESALGLSLFSVGHAIWGPSQVVDPVALIAMAGIAAFLPPVAFAAFGLYGSQRRKPISAILGAFLVAGLVILAILPTSAALLGQPSWVSWTIPTAALQAAGLVALRGSIVGTLRVGRRFGRNFRSVVVVGVGPRAQTFIEETQQHPEWGLRVESLVDEIEPAIPWVKAEFHKLADFPRLLRTHVVDEVVVAVPRSMIDRVEPVVAACAEVGVPIQFLSDLFGEYVPPPALQSYGRFRTLSFARAHHSQLEFAAKRLLDLFGGLALLAVALPVMACVAVAVRLTSRGPVIFRQTRCGLHGRPFEMLKFRTMVEDAEARLDEVMHLNEADGPVFKIENDPRMTSIGHFLRSYSLDETPQFWNVVKGEMSLVGPRPPLPDEVASYEPSTRRRLSMRPGMTCLWQVSGRSDVSFGEWVKLDLEYIDRWSLLLDLEILLRTIWAVLSRAGAK